MTRPRPAFRARSALPPPGFGCARLATLTFAPPHPEGGKAEGRKTNYRNRFTPTFIFGFTNIGYTWDYGNGRHGAYILTTNTTIEQLYQTVRLTNDPALYNPFDTNAIPNFQNFIITNGAILTANPWNGSSGGWIALKIEATLAIASGATISVNGIGSRGGSSGAQGESYGGGGGGFQFGSSNGHPNYAGAGGGGYGGNGNDGIGYFYYGGTPIGGAPGGSSYGTASLNTVYLGSGGGGNVGGGGGNGGGVIVLNAGNLQVQGQVQANGNSSGSGGGGSGGSILFRLASAVLRTSNVAANGGSGGMSNGGGGNGGVGRIAIYYAETFSGTSSPAAYIAQDTNSDNVTVIMTHPVTQTNFLATNVTFSVGVYGLSTLIFQWNFNGISIPGATNQILSLNNIALTNTGNYSVTISNAVMSVVSSNAFLKVLDTAIPLADGIPNWWKLQCGFSTNDSTFATNYPPSDKLTYLAKYLYGLNPFTNDTDGDGLTDYDEIFNYHTNPLLGNTAGDGIPDGWKIQYGIDPLIAVANTEAGFDGVTCMQIYQYDLTHTNQLDPRNPFALPGASSYEILNNGQHTNKFYYDHEDRLLGIETSRGISIGYQYDGNGNLTRQTVMSRTDEGTNGLPVLWRFLNGLTNSANSGAYADADGDGWSNYQEWLAGTDPNNTTNTPNSLGNPGANIASLVMPFTPTNFVAGVGQLDGTGAEEMVIGADGNPGTNNNFLLVLTKSAFGWSTQRVDVGSFGVTSIAVGQMTNRPVPAIYAGLRGTTNGSGRVMEFANSGGIWQSNLVVLSTNKTAFVLGLRGQDLLVSCGTTIAPDGSLSAASFLTNWNLSLMDTNSSHRGLGTLIQPQSQTASASALRLLDSAGISAGTTQVSGLVPNLISYWKLDESSGNAMDSVGTNTLINNNNVSYGSGIINNGADFGLSNVNKYLSYGGPITASNYSVSFWVKLNSEISSGTYTFFGWNSVQTGVSVSAGYKYNSGARKIYFERAENFVGFDDADYAVSLGASVWHQLVYVYDGSTVCGYLDGSQVTSISSASGATSWSDTQMSLGCGINSNDHIPGSFSSIKIDEVGIWSRALSSAEVSLLYGNGNGVFSLSISEPTATSRLLWRGKSLASGSVRSGQTNASSVFYIFGDDLNGNNILDAGDDFVTAEYSVAATNATITTLSRQRIASSVTAQSYGLASVNYLNQSNAVFFTGEPDGQVFSWTATGATNPLQRQLFSSQYYGKAWHALAAIKTLDNGESLAGLCVDPTNQNTCDVILWPSQTVLPSVPQASAVETAPSAAVVPSANPLGSNAVVTVRLWDNEGNASTPFLQYQILGSTNWQNTTLTTLDGATYSTATRVTSLPGGYNHTLRWNSLADIGANVVTNVLLRACSQDYALLGTWSQPTPFQLNTTISTTPTNTPVNFTGVSFTRSGLVFNWQGNSNDSFYIQRSFSLTGTNVNWVNIWTGVPPTPISGSYTDSIGTNRMGFYRIKSVFP